MTKQETEPDRALHDQDVGFCLIEVRDDAHGGRCDFRFIEANAAFSRHTGLEVIGRWMRDGAQSDNLGCFDQCADIVCKGQPAHFEYAEPGPGKRYFDVYAHQVDHPEQRRIAVMLSDITARKHEEARRAAMFELSDLMAQCDDSASLADAASAILGRTLDVHLVGYGTVDAAAETLTVERDWTVDGARSLAGTVQFRDFGSYIEDFKRGETVVVVDARTDPRTAAFADALEARSARAFVNTPIFERGEWVALQYVSSTRPRDWSDDELRFIREVGARIRVASARIDAEQATRTLAASLDRQVQLRTRQLDQAWLLSQELLVVARPDGVIEDCNPMWEQVLGYEVQELAGRNFIDFTHPDDLERTLVVFGSILTQPLTEPYAYRFRHKDGRYLWFAWTGAFDAGRVYAAGRDLSAERARDKALRDAEEFTRLALASVGGVGVWTFDLVRNQYIGDAAIAELYGLDPARLADGVSVEEMTSNIHPDDLPGVRAAIRRSLASNADAAMQYRLMHPDGTVRWVLSRWRNYLDESGAPIRRSGVGIEVTSQRNVEDQLHQAQKMEAVGQLTGGLAHDFNNLLAGITGALSLMQIRMRQGRFDDLDRFMSVAQGAAKRAAALTHRLLAFSRSQTLEPRPTDINGLVQGMEELIRRTIGPQITLEVVGAIGLWPTLVDPGQLENALLNLCINARDAMPEGGRITIETANKWLDYSSSTQYEIPEGQYLSLCVSDTGTGMKPELLARVFEPFFTTKPLGEGTGLGLSMIHGFARQSGGQVRIYSEVGEGTTVCLYLPRHYGEIDPEQDAQQQGEVAPDGSGETVLIVDDEPSVRMLVVEVLKDMGYTAIEAADSPAGLKLLQSDTRIDLLITDVGLPGGMNGRQMADAGRERRPGLKVLFVTGYAENSLIGNGHLLPGMQVLTKPFEIEVLAIRIKEMLASS